MGLIEKKVKLIFERNMARKLPIHQVKSEIVRMRFNKTDYRDVMRELHKSKKFHVNKKNITIKR